MKTCDRGYALSAALAAVMCLAAGCSDSHSSQAAHAAAASADDSSDEVNHFQPCEKLSVADVQPFFNTPIKKIAELPSSAPSQNRNFATIDGIQGIQISTIVGSMVKAFTDKLPTDDSKPGIPLSGIGDSAIRESNDIWVYAIKNGVFCMIHGDHAGENAQGSVEEIRGQSLTLFHTIPAATAQAVAQNLGTLCNKIWGSGNMTPSFADPH